MTREVRRPQAQRTLHKRRQRIQEVGESGRVVEDSQRQDEAVALLTSAAAAISTSVLKLAPQKCPKGGEGHELHPSLRLRIQLIVTGKQETDASWCSHPSGVQIL